MAKPRKQNSSSRQSIRTNGRLTGLDAALRRRSASLSPAEQSIVMFMRQNLATIPFETGASMAQKSGVSEMTVLRFIRSLGFANLKVSLSIRLSFTRIPAMTRITAVRCAHLHDS